MSDFPGFRQGESKSRSFWARIRAWVPVSQHIDARLKMLSQELRVDVFRKLWHNRRQRFTDRLLKVAAAHALTCSVPRNKTRFLPQKCATGQIPPTRLHFLLRRRPL